MRTVQVLLLLALTGCKALLPDFAFTSGPRKDEGIAARIVWVETYGQSGRAPSVNWVDWNKMSSPKCGTDEKRGFVSVYTGGCVAGTTVGSVTIVVQKDGRFSSSAYAHELLHVAWMLDGRWLPHHPEGPWRQCSEGEQPTELSPFLRSCILPADAAEFYGLVDKANAALRAAGL